MPRRGGLIAIGLLAALLSGCGPTPEEQRAMDQQKCAGFGFQPGTDAFATCMMSTVQQRDAQEAADRRAWEARQAAERQTAAARAAQQASDPAGSSSSSSGTPAFSMPTPDLSGMKCTSTSSMSGSPNNSTTTTNTSCHN